MKKLDAPPAGHRVILEPGLPPLVQELAGGGWRTALSLPALHALSLGLPRHRPPEGVLAELLEPGDVPVILDTDDGFPSEMQLLNLRYLVHMDEALASAILLAVLGDYPRLRQTYDFLPEGVLPDAVTEAALRRLIRLDSLTIHAIPHASTPYLGADFACVWDEEHGMGVLTYGTEILALGTGDISQDRAAAQAHRDDALEALKSK